MKTFVCIAVCTLLASSAALGQQAIQWRAQDGGNDHWYRLSSDVCGWTEARNRADRLGGHLASISSDPENAFVLGLGIGRAWIGAFQEPGACEPGCFSWVTGEPWVYDRWMAGQPDGFAGSENYAEIRGNSFWNDLNANWQFAYVVEWSSDCDGNGIVDYGQIASGQARDANGNGILDCCETGTCCTACDLNASGSVDGADLGVLLAFWGTVSPAFPKADIDRDGSVSGADLAILLGNWGSCQR